MKPGSLRRAARALTARWATFPAPTLLFSKLLTDLMALKLYSVLPATL